MQLQSRIELRIAAVSCSSIPYYPAGVKMELGLTGKLGLACFGAWVGVWLYGGGINTDPCIALNHAQSGLSINPNPILTPAG